MLIVDDEAEIVVQPETVRRSGGRDHLERVDRERLKIVTERIEVLRIADPSSNIDRRRGLS